MKYCKIFLFVIVLFTLLSVSSPSASAQSPLIDPKDVFFINKWFQDLGKWFTKKPDNDFDVELARNRKKAQEKYLALKEDEAVFYREQEKMQQALDGQENDIDQQIDVILNTDPSSQDLGSQMGLLNQQEELVNKVLAQESERVAAQQTFSERLKKISDDLILQSKSNQDWLRQQFAIIEDQKKTLVNLRNLTVENFRRKTKKINEQMKGLFEKSSQDQQADKAKILKDLNQLNSQRRRVVENRKTVNLRLGQNEYTVSDQTEFFVVNLIEGREEDWRTATQNKKATNAARAEVIRPVSGREQWKNQDLKQRNRDRASTMETQKGLLLNQKMSTAGAGMDVPTRINSQTFGR